MIVNSVIWPNGKTVHVRVYDETDSNLDVDWTATGVTEVAVTADYSRYKYDVTVVSEHEYTIDFKTVEDSPYFTHVMLRKNNTIVGSGTGARQVTIQLYLTATTTPIASVNIQIFNSTQTVLVASGTSDILGQKTFALADATYKVRLAKVGSNFTVPETITVTADSTKTLYGDVISIGVPASASNIRVYDYFYEADDATPVTTLKATAKIKLLPYDYNGKIHIGDHVDVTYSSVTGLGYWDIVKGATVEFKSSKFFDTPITETLPTTGTTIRLSDM